MSEEGSRKKKKSKNSKKMVVVQKKTQKKTKFQKSCRNKINNNSRRIWKAAYKKHIKKLILEIEERTLKRKERFGKAYKTC